MPNINVYNMEGKVIGSMDLNDKIFAAEINKPVLHSVVRAYLMNQRQGTQSTLTRSEVSGGGRKPWRQKGTGRARQGSIRSPQWTHGGIALGPKPRTYKKSINKKVKRIAMMSALSAKVQAGELIIVDNIALAEYKTKAMIAMLNSLEAIKKPLIVLDTVDNMVVKSASNIPTAKTTPVNAISVYDILNCNKMVIAKDAVLKLEEVYA
ncbi:50S ribosomal protein L4 [Eubacteriales bacterium OttesenSCG-928-G02]|nr:50S ribosomal protein L4 [Eubacteriales bacterium OttesenSCG-928-G02]